MLCLSHLYSPACLYSPVFTSVFMSVFTSVFSRQVYSFQNKMELAEVLAKLDPDGYQLVDHDFNEL